MDRRFCPFCAAALGPRAGSRQDCSGCGRPYFHNAAPTCAVLVVDGDRVLLARRAIDPGIGLWDLPGGFCEPDETPDEAAVRELREEAGVEIVVTGFLGHVVDTYGTDGDRTLNAVYLARITEGTPVPADDVAELAWFAAADLPGPDEIAFANTIEALARWRAGRG